MKFKLEIEMDNAAFVGLDGMVNGQELSKILFNISRYFKERSFGDQVEASNIRDINGNKVGNWEVTE